MDLLSVGPQYANEEMKNSYDNHIETINQSLSILMRIGTTPHATLEMDITSLPQVPQVFPTSSHLCNT